MNNRLIASVFLLFVISFNATAQQNKGRDSARTAEGYYELGKSTSIFFNTTAQNLRFADSLRLRGEMYHDQGKFGEAQTYYDKAYHLYKVNHDTASLLITGVYKGEILSYQSKMDEAIALFNHLKLINHHANNDSLKSRIESDLGWTYKQMGKVEESINHLQKGLTFARQADDSLMIGITLNNLANSYRGQDKLEQSLEYYKNAISIFENLENKRSQAFALNNMGDIYLELYIFERALNSYSQSLEIAKDLDNVNLLASVYDSMGRIYKETGAYNQSLVAFQTSLQYRRQTNNVQNIGSVLNNIGMLYSRMGNSEKALEYFRESLSLWQQASNPSQLATAHRNMAMRLWDLGRHEEAIINYKKAVALKRKTGTPRSIATFLVSLAKVENEQGNRSAARAYIHDVSSIADSTQDKSLLKDAAYWNGFFEATDQNFESAIRHFKSALEYSYELPLDARISPLKQLAYSYNKMQSDSALYYGQKAIEVIEKERSEIGPMSQLKASYFKQHVDFYILMASWQLTYNDDIAAAYHLIESAKSRALADELAQAARRIDESLPEEERIKRARHISAITTLYSQLKNTSGSKEELRAKIRNKELAYASFENQLQQEYDQYKYFKNPERISLPETQQMCDSQTAILEYAISKDKLLVFFITQNNVQAKQFAINGNPSSSTDLVSRVKQFRQAIISRQSENTIKKESKRLYELLIAPFETRLASYKNLLVVPDGILAYLPFEALVNQDNYLVSQYNIKYAPSMTGLSLIQPPERAANNKMLAIGNSNNYKANDKVAVLPAVGLEINSISDLFPEATVLKDQEITEQYVTNLLQKEYSYIHVAAHSVIDETNSSMSGIMLGETGTGNEIGKDGYLRSSEIYRMNIVSDMVVLSACKSGIGDIVNGEGMLGLQRAFFNAGTSTVAVSLWDVYDRSTTQFMKIFYKALLNREDNRSWGDTWQSFLRWSGWDNSMPFGYSSRAMREAKLTMLEHPEYHHPVYWAPFIVVGR